MLFYCFMTLSFTLIVLITALIYIDKQTNNYLTLKILFKYLNMRKCNGPITRKC